MNPPLVDAKDEMLLELCKEEEAILESIIPRIDNHLTH